MLSISMSYCFAAVDAPYRPYVTVTGRHHEQTPTASGQSRACTSVISCASRACLLAYWTTSGLLQLRRPLIVPSTAISTEGLTLLHKTGQDSFETVHHRVKHED